MSAPLFSFSRFWSSFPRRRESRATRTVFRSASRTFAATLESRLRGNDGRDKARLRTGP